MDLRENFIDLVDIAIENPSVRTHIEKAKYTCSQLYAESVQYNAIKVRHDTSIWLDPEMDVP